MALQSVAVRKKNRCDNIRMNTSRNKNPKKSPVIGKNSQENAEIT